MRYTIFAAALIASTQALKTSNLSQLNAKSKQEQGWCDNIHPDFSTMRNSLYDSQFDSGIVWYDRMGQFWTTMNGSAAFYWFDCEHGNGDGMVTYDEFAAGLEDGYVEDMQCYQNWHSTWAEESGSDNINVAKTDYRKTQWGYYMELWAALADSLQTQDVTFNKWMNNAADSGLLDIREASVFWNQVNNGTFSWKDQTITKQQFQGSVSQNINAQIDWFRKQYALIENSLVVEPMWYFTQQCFDPASYWFALVQDPNTYGFNSTVQFDYDQFMNHLCNNWELCEDKME